MIIEVPDSIREDYERIKKYSIAKAQKEYIPAHPLALGIDFDTIVLCDMMATYIAFHDLNAKKTV